MSILGCGNVKGGEERNGKRNFVWGCGEQVERKRMEKKGSIVVGVGRMGRRAARKIRLEEFGCEKGMCRVDNEREDRFREREPQVLEGN